MCTDKLVIQLKDLNVDELQAPTVPRAPASTYTHWATENSLITNLLSKDPGHSALRQPQSSHDDQNGEAQICLAASSLTACGSSVLSELCRLTKLLVCATFLYILSALA